MFERNTKANALNLIKTKLNSTNIPHYIFFTKKNFEKNKELYLKKINNKFKLHQHFSGFFYFENLNKK